MARLMNLRKARAMDDQAGTKVIAAIERLSNRIAKLDDLSLETVAVATEARRAAMDTAEATSPKQTTKYLATHIKPVVEKFDGEFRTSIDHMNKITGQLLGHVQTAGDTLKAAYGDAAFVACEYKHCSRNFLIATVAIGVFTVAITLLSAWIFYDQLLRSRTRYEVFGGIYEWSLETGRFCIIGAR